MSGPQSPIFGHLCQLWKALIAAGKAEIAVLRIMVLFNPISGAGRAAAAAQEAAAFLQALGHQVIQTHTRKESPETWLDQPMAAVQLTVVVGGDGAVRLAGDSACRTGTPLYHLPYGTENLFAREFGMDRTLESLGRAIERFEVRKADAATANGETFLLMASVGFDADVVHELAGQRGASISHLSYLVPIWAQLRRWRPPHLQITADGRRIYNGGPGFVVVANSRQYGWRLNPAGRASMFDGRLDVAFFPTRSRTELIGWAWRCRWRRQFADPRLVYCLARHVTIASHAPLRYQLDGDPPGSGDGVRGAQPLQLDIEIRPAALPVLVP